MANQPRRSKISPGPGQLPKDAEFVDVLTATEPWTQIDLADGSIIKLKPVVAEIWRVIGEYDGEGNPVYLVKTQNVMSVIASEDLKRKGLH